MSRQYFEHDIRDNHSVFKHRGMGRRHRKYREAGRSASNFSKLLLDVDGDVDMSVLSLTNERRFNPYSGARLGQHSRKDKKRNKTDINSLLKNDSEGISWYKITIPYGKKSGKEFILKSITSLCKVPFTPFNFQFSGNAAEFFVNDYTVARQIKDIHRRVTFPDGYKMGIIMGKSSAPVSVMNADVEKIIKATMSNHYDVLNHTLNLTKFHHDPNLRAQGLYIPIYKPVIFNAVVRIIKENIPELEALNLSDNKLYSLENLAPLVPVCRQLKGLILQNNKLRNITELNHLKGLELLDLVLDGNPFCDDFRDKNSYISSVRERFPKLIRLDGHDLPPPIGFDLGPETVPTSKKSFFLADDVKDMVVAFLDQYYSIYDSGDRSKLLDAYHDQASFSLTISKNMQKPSNNSSLNAYSSENRNLLRLNDHNLRYKLLKQGRLSVVSTLSEMPQTMHDPSSFSVDIFHISPGLMAFNVVGVFKEVGVDINNAALKTFNRTFLVSAQGQGFVIVNETFFIALASSDQVAKAFKVPAPTPSPSPAPSTSDEKSPTEKQLLIAELIKQTGMNPDFSSKCLEDNDWDFSRAFTSFIKLRSDGVIPPEAFVNNAP